MTQRPQDQAQADQFRQQMEQLGQDQKFHAALDELARDPTLRKQAAADPAGHFRSKGVTLPPGITMTLRPDNWCLLVVGALGYYCCWTTVSWFPTSCTWGPCC